MKEPAHDSAAIQGRVVNALTGAPVKRATVRMETADVTMTGSPQQSQKVVETDADGGYQFPDVPPGRYTISAVHSNFVRSNFVRAGQRYFTVSPGSNLRDANIRLAPKGSASGIVVDADGDPVPAALVSFYRYQVAPLGRRQFYKDSQATTDENGRFRVSGLIPTRYYVSASPRASVTERSLYMTTYYPGTLDQAQAAPVLVSAGTETPSVTIQMRKASSVVVSGKAVGPDGSPVSYVSIRLRPADRTQGTGNVVYAPIVADSHFVFSRVLPGSYVIDTTSGSVLIGPTGPSKRKYTIQYPIQVGEHEITDLELHFDVCQPVSGTVTFDESARKAWEQSKDVPRWDSTQRTCRHSEQAAR